jgi:hypothetical protein
MGDRVLVIDKDNCYFTNELYKYKYTSPNVFWISDFLFWINNNYVRYEKKNFKYLLKNIFMYKSIFVTVQIKKIHLVIK